MKIFKMNLLRWVMPFVIIASVGGSMLALAAPQTATAAPPDDCNQGFLGFPSWYRGLTKPAPGCNMLSPNDPQVGGISNFIWRVALNVVEMAVVAIAFLSGFMFLYGGWMFIISQGKPESAAKARSIMTMSVMGLVLMLSAVALVEFIFSKVIK